MRTFLPLAIALAGCSLFLTGCVEENDVVYTERPAVYGTTADVDFYYVGDAPYSRQYGMLYHRDNGYYYRHGSGYVIYNRPVYSRTSYTYSQRTPPNSREARGQWDERYVRWDRERAKMNRDNDGQRVSNRDREEQKSRARGVEQGEDLERHIERRKTAAN